MLISNTLKPACIKKIKATAISIQNLSHSVLPERLKFLQHQLPLLFFEYTVEPCG